MSDHLEEGSRDLAVRMAAFEYLADRIRAHGEVLPASVLKDGFPYGGSQVHLKGQQGIFKPRILALPLSITTAPPRPGRPRPYDDGLLPDGTILYRYRGTDPRHRDNVGLRRAKELGRPLIYFHGVTEGEYFTVFPVFVVHDQPEDLCFRVVADDAVFVGGPHPAVAEAQAEARRAYITTTVRRRLHQEAFRARVLRAYQERCALCRLRHERLLDAAHIVPDADPLGEPLVSNGIALCKLHHAAFDQHILGIVPDTHRIQIRQDVLEEEDGPMLIHGLQGFHGHEIWTPDAAELRPRPDFLRQRFESFLVAGRS